MNKPVLHILLSVCLSFFAVGQENLVPNGSFEEYSQCPQGNELNNGQFERAVGWWRPTMGTPDYFHRCNNSLGGVVGVPDNLYGSQEAFEGDGYIGFVPIAIDVNGNHVDSEYCRTKLKCKLSPNTSYKFSMKLALSAFSSTVAIGRLGVYFSEDNTFTDTWLNLNVQPQLINLGLPLSDTLNWMSFDGVYVARGCEEYLTIGYFANNFYNDSMLINSPTFGYYSYYFIDSVSLFQVDFSSDLTCESLQSFSLPNIFTPNSDGINDEINITQQLFFLEKVEIINRWGNLVVTLDEFNPFWDGQDCPDGVYFYIIYFREDKKRQTGFIHLVR